MLIRDICEVKDGEIKEIAENNCFIYLEHLKAKITYLAGEFQIETSGKNVDRLFDYIGLNKLNRSNDYLHIISLSEKAIKKLENIKSIDAKLSQAEEKTINEFRAWDSSHLEIKKLSDRTIGRFWKSMEGKMDQKQRSQFWNKTKILIRFVIAPKLKTDEKTWNKFLVEAEKFFGERKKEIYKKKIDYTKEALEFHSEDYRRDIEEYLIELFDILIILEDETDEKWNFDQSIWAVFEGTIKEMFSTSILSESINIIRQKSVPELVREYEQYRKEYGEATLNTPQFLTVGFYHISHTFYVQWLNDNEKKEYQHMALVLCKYTAKKYGSVLHPACEISAPCILHGRKIIVYPNSVIDANCCLEAGVFIAGALDEEDLIEKGNTRIEKGVTIKEGAQLIDGVKIGQNSVVEKDVILIGDEIDDNYYVGVGGVRIPIKKKEDYVKYAGFIEIPEEIE